MNISLDAPNADLFIKRYQPGELILNTGPQTSSVLLHHKCCEPWPVSSPYDINTESIMCLLSYQADIVLLGTGKDHVFPDMAALAPLIQQGIGIECMHTEAACRTYTIMQSEGRNVLAALIV